MYCPIFLFVLLITAVAAIPIQEEQPTLYTGDKVIRVVPETKENLQILLKLRDDFPKLDFWKEPDHEKGFVDLHLAAHEVEAFTKYLESQNLKYTILIADLQELINKEKDTMKQYRKRRSLTSSLSMTAYHTFEEIEAWLNTVANMCPAGLECTVESLGRSYENRKLPVIVIRKNDTQARKAVWIDGGMHAREWISPATVLSIIHKLVLEYETNSDAQSLLEKYDWHIMPVANPDGYSYSINNVRLWRKTRSVNSNTSCKGVDPNRNFNFHWAERGSSSSPCSEVYHGPSAFSEPETAALSNYILSGGANHFHVYISFHSYGQLWLTPWGHTRDVPDDFDDLKNMAQIGADAVRGISGTQYLVGSSTRILYAAAGGSEDWAKGVGRVKYAYTIELRDNGAHGFILPENLIEPTTTEMWAGLVAFTEAL